MVVITKISIQKNATDRYNIFLNDRYAFSVDEQVLIQYQLKKGKQLSELELMQIQSEDEIRKAYNVATQYLSFRMRAKQEVRTYLERKEYEERVIDAVLQKLTDQQYIDDVEFATAYVRTYMQSGKKGPVMIERELKEKGVHEAEINQAMLLYKKEEQLSHAVKLGNKYAHKNRKLSERMLKQKVEYHLASRGFPFDLISVALEEIEYEKCDQEEWETLLIEGEKAHRRYKKYSGYEYKERMQRALFRRGFSVEQINRFIEKKNEARTNER